MLATLTTYLGAVDVPDGYTGSRAVLHLCQEPDGTLWAVLPFGCYRESPDARPEIRAHLLALGAGPSSTEQEAAARRVQYKRARRAAGATSGHELDREALALFPDPPAPDNGRPWWHD